MKLDLHRGIEADLIEVQQELFEARPGWDVLFVEDFSLLLDRIQSAPLACERLHLKEVKAHLRRAHFGRFPYTIVYRVDEAGVFVLSVHHQRRKPGHWAHRARP